MGELTASDPILDPEKGGKMALCSAASYVSLLICGAASLAIGLLASAWIEAILGILLMVIGSVELNGWRKWRLRSEPKFLRWLAWNQILLAVVVSGYLVVQMMLSSPDRWLAMLETPWIEAVLSLYPREAVEMVETLLPSLFEWLFLAMIVLVWAGSVTMALGYRRVLRKHHLKLRKGAS